MTQDGDTDPEGTRTGWASWILVGLALFAALKITKWVTMPIAFALVLSMAIAPIDRAISKRLPGRLGWVGLLAAMLAVAAATLFYGSAFYFLFRQAAEVVPTFVDELRMRIESLSQSGMIGEVRRWLATTLGIDAPVEGSGILGALSSLTGSVATSATQLVSLSLLVFFFSLLMLSERQDWAGKLGAVSPEADESHIVRLAEAIAKAIRSYVLVRTVLAVITAVLYGAWLWLFDVSVIWVWIVLAFLLGYIPTIGSAISGLLPFLFVLGTRDLGVALGVGAGLFVIEQVMGNYVDPRLQGEQLSLSPLVVLISILFWGFVWGIAGAILAVPLTVALALVAQELPAMRPLAVLLGRSAPEGTTESA